MTHRRIFCAMMCIIGLACIISASSLRMMQRPTLGPGMMPMIYAVLLVVLSVLFFLQKDASVKIDFRAMLKPPAVEGVIFYVANLGMFLVLYLFGTIVAMLVFCLVVLFLFKSLSRLKVFLFSCLWVASLYILFVVLLGVPFEDGILVEAFKRAFIY